jgi:hypothetical protein
MKTISIYFLVLLFIIGMITIYSPTTEAGSTGINIKHYCKSKYGYKLGYIDAELIGRNKNAFAWRCIEYKASVPYLKKLGRNNEYGINMNNACKWQTGKSWAQAYLKDGKTHSYSWRCKY